MPITSQYTLRDRQGTGDWQEITLNEGDTLIGRDEGCTFVLKQDDVSRHHARLNLRGNDISLTDLGSSNGTQIEGQHLTPHKPSLLQPGQAFSIGEFVLLVELSDRVVERAKTRTIGEEKPGYRLRYRLGEGPWQEIGLSMEVIILGRASDCQLFLPHHDVSRRHARLELSENQIWLTDLGSSNGTQVDNNPLYPRQKFSLSSGQGFTIGSYSLIVEHDTGSESERMKSIPGGSSTVLIPGAPAIAAGEAGALETLLGVEEIGLPPVERSLDLTSQERVTIRRAADNNVVLNHPLISRYHAVIERMGTRFRLLDLRSTNGVFVNGQRIERESWLKDWDRVRIGPFAFLMTGFNLQAQAELSLRIEVQNINQRVSKSLNLLQDINLTTKPMEFVALVGMSGSGKTTLLNAISGYRPASDGQVLVDGLNLYQHYDLFRNDIGYVPQKDIVHVELTPETALEYVARLRMPPDTNAQERQTVVSEVLSDLDLTERRNIPITRLSGGQLKRVSIGVELLTKPRLFFLDEPTSGLDPGTEYDMMKLLRRLADQGRTVLLVTHATKNVMLCDKVIFLARGGHLAFFGPPEEALVFFDSHRTDRERREKEMEFDDIYRILNDETRGSPAGWAERYRKSPYHKANISRLSTPHQPVEGSRASLQGAVSPFARASKLQSSQARVSAVRQFIILSMRNLKILAQDKIFLALMLALAPVIGLMDFIWGTKLYDPVEGDAAKIITMWFMMALVTVLIGALSSVREIVKEVDIYKRERAVNLKIMPYVLSKVWVGVVLAIYQAGVLLFFLLVFVHPEVPSIGGYLLLYGTLFLGTLLGYLIGLMISASAPNQNAAMMLIIVVLVPQFLFTGALLPLDLIPGGEIISVFMPTRWAFESFLRISEIGEQMVDDPCWLYSKADRLSLPESLKKNCPCMGESIFSQCAEFPGILSYDFFDKAAQAALVQPKPEEPPQPTSYPYPTALPSPTSLPTPTPYPALTPYPTPENPANMVAYMDSRQEQGKEFQEQMLAQFEDYRHASQEQGQEYSLDRTRQGDEYALLRQTQGDEFSDHMRKYGDDRAVWQESREKAISSAEGVLGSIYDNYGHAFQGTVVGR